MIDRKNAINVLSNYKIHSFGDKDKKVTVEDIIALLKTQEPVEPKKLLARSALGYKWRFYCGECGSEIDRIDEYCRHCGHEVKWDG